MDDSIKRVSFQHVMDKVVGSVKENNPVWFEMHKEVFFEMADYMFELTYDMNTFSKLFYEALGFMGRNFRFRDDEKFLPLEYFINRYISEQSLDLEHYFLHNTLLKLTNTNNSLIIIDTKGEMSRKKSIITTIHGRYRTVGYTDLRAIFDQLDKAHAAADEDETVLRLSMDAKATIPIGLFFRNGKSRIIVKAMDHDFEPDEKLTPYGIFLPKYDELYLYFTSSHITRDFIVDCLDDFWLAVQARFPQIKTISLLPALPQQIQPHRTRLGCDGKTLEW